MEPSLPLSHLTVPKLKEKCRELGIPVGGKKAELVMRIEAKLGCAQAVTPLSTPAQVGQAATKRKIQVKNPSHASGEQGSKKKRRASEVPEGVLEAVSQLPAFLPEVRQHPSNLNTIAIKQNQQQFSSTQTVATTKANEGLVKTGAVVRNHQTIALKPQLQLQFGPSSLGLNSIDSFSTNFTVSREDLALLPQTNSRILQREVLPEENIPFLSPNQQATCTKADIPRLQKNIIIKESRLSQNIEISYSTPLLQTHKVAIQSEVVVEANKQLLPGSQGVVQKKSVLNPRKDLPDGPRQGGGLNNASGIGSIGCGNSEFVYGVKDAQGNGPVITVLATNRRFKGLQPAPRAKSITPELTEISIPAPPKPNDATDSHRNTIRGAARSTTRSTTTVFPPLTVRPLRCDLEISASIIRNPPRYSLRRQVEKTALVLALTAFHGFSPHSYSSVPGDYLKHFTGLSRGYRYASTLAFTHLIRIEFPGKRTENWLRVKRIDMKVADVRPWYWHRVAGRARVVEQLRTSWVERVWRFLVLGSVPATPHSPTDTRPGRFGLWFSGVSKNLLADPDLEGQFDTAIRFWIRRFYVWVTRNGGGYPQLLQDLREEMVLEIYPLDEKDSRELWRLETKCGGLYFIIGMTGEVVGWVEVDGTAGTGLMPARQMRTKTRARNIFRAGTTVRGTARTQGGLFPVESPPENGKNWNNMDNIDWKDLRGDWREHASALLSSSPSGVLPRGLLESVYCPDSKTVSHGIHKSVKLPHHRMLAERWILAQVEPGGISGKPVLDAPNGQSRRKEKIAFDLQAKLTVESVRCSGEKWISSMKGVLAQGLGFVQTPGMGWFVLEETGQNIAQEEYGIQGLWATVLGVYENGVAMSTDELEELVEMFVLT